MRRLKRMKPRSDNSGYFLYRKEEVFTLSEIGKIIRKDFPRDEMMFELHMLRVLMALERKDLTLEDLFKEPGTKGRAEPTG